MCDRFPRKFDVQTSYKPSNVIVVVNIKFPRATYHTLLPSTEELYCLIRVTVKTELLQRIALLGSARILRKILEAQGYRQWLSLL